jgi:glycosyltransferase involved in cell wall biosynthesis
LEVRPGIVRAVAGDKTRVLFVNTPTCVPMGADTWIHTQIIGRLDRCRHDVHVALAAGQPGRRTPLFEALQGVTRLRVRPVNFGPELSGRSRSGKFLALIATLPALVSLASLARYVRNQRIDVIHTSDRPRDALACVILARLTKVPCIVHVHTAHGPWMGGLVRWTLRRADALVAVSEFVGRSLVAAGHAPERVHVVLNAVDLDAWKPGLDRDNARHELALDPASLAVLTVCRLAPEKGPAELIEAFARVRAESPEATLLIAGLDLSGDRGFAAELLELVRRRDLVGRVRFLGWRDDVPRLMAAADVYAMPSTGEPFGLVFAEAMAMELPVIGLADGGTPEVVEHDRTGLLSAHGDGDALAANVARLLGHPELRTQFGERGRQRVEAHLTTERMARDVASVYARVTSRSTNGLGRGSTAMDSAGGPSSAVLDRPALDTQGFAHRLDRDGYVIFRDVVSKERLAELDRIVVEEFERARDANELFEGGGSVSGHLNCFPGEPARFVYDELARAGIFDLVRAVRPDIADSVRATMNFNLPGSVAQHYHMDGLYTKEFLICNVAVVDTDLVNGALDVLPGTNREFYKFWRYAIERKFRLSTRVPMARGDVIVRKSTLWHRGMPNRSAAPRPMMAITFGEMDPTEADPFKVNGGRIEFYPNWFSTSRLGRLRERTFVAAPVTYSAYRFVRSLHGNRGYDSW